MIESDRDRDTLNVVRPFIGRSSGGVYGETVAVQAHMSNQNEHQSVEMETEFCGEEFGERKSRKMQDPKLPSSEEVLGTTLTIHLTETLCQRTLQGESPLQDARRAEIE